MSIGDWRRNGWIPQIPGDPDNRGWFQWYCRYYLGRRIQELDDIQIKRWRAFKRHYGQVYKNCSSLDCRPKQRQALLQWSYNAFVINVIEIFKTMNYITIFLFISCKIRKYLIFNNLIMVKKR
jgi:hypothetical protein